MGSCVAWSMKHVGSSCPTDAVGYGGRTDNITPAVKLKMLERWPQCHSACVRTYHGERDAEGWKRQKLTEDKSSSTAVAPKCRVLYLPHSSRVTHFLRECLKAICKFGAKTSKEEELFGNKSYRMILYEKGFGAFNLLGRVYGSSWPRAFVLAIPSTIFGALLRIFVTHDTASHFFLHPFTCKWPELQWFPHTGCQYALNINIPSKRKKTED